MHPATQGSVTWTTAINLNPSNTQHVYFGCVLNRCFLCVANGLNWSLAYVRCVQLKSQGQLTLCEHVCSSVLMLTANTCWFPHWSALDTEQMLGIIREDSGKLWARASAEVIYCGDAEGPPLNLQWEVRWNKPRWACESGLKTNVFLLSFNWKKNSKSSSVSPAEWRREEILIPQTFIKVLIYELISGIMTLKCQHGMSNWVQGESLEAFCVCEVYPNITQSYFFLPISGHPGISLSSYSINGVV